MKRQQAIERSKRNLIDHFIKFKKKRKKSNTSDKSSEMNYKKSSVLTKCNILKEREMKKTSALAEVANAGRRCFCDPYFAWSGESEPMDPCLHRQASKQKSILMSPICKPLVLLLVSRFKSHERRYFLRSSGIFQSQSRKSDCGVQEINQDVIICPLKNSCINQKKRKRRRSKQLKHHPWFPIPPKRKPEPFFFLSKSLKLN